MAEVGTREGRVIHLSRTRDRLVFVPNRFDHLVKRYQNLGLPIGEVYHALHNEDLSKVYELAEYEGLSREELVLHLIAEIFDDESVDLFISGLREKRAYTKGFQSAAEDTSIDASYMDSMEPNEYRMFCIGLVRGGNAERVRSLQMHFGVALSEAEIHDLLAKDQAQTAEPSQKTPQKMPAYSWDRPAKKRQRVFYVPTQSFWAKRHPASERFTNPELRALSTIFKNSLSVYCVLPPEGEWAAKVQEIISERLEGKIYSELLPQVDRHTNIEKYLKNIKDTVPPSKAITMVEERTPQEMTLSLNKKETEVEVEEDYPESLDAILSETSDGNLPPEIFEPEHIEHQEEVNPLLKAIDAVIGVAHTNTDLFLQICRTKDALNASFPQVLEILLRHVFSENECSRDFIESYLDHRTFHRYRVFSTIAIVGKDTSVGFHTEKLRTLDTSDVYAVRTLLNELGESYSEKFEMALQYVQSSVEAV